MSLSNLSIILVIILILCLIALLLAALGLGLGLLLTVIIPSLPMGHAIIAGTIAAVAASLILFRAIDAVSAQINPEDELPDTNVEALAKELLRQKPDSGRTRPRK